MEPKITAVTCTCDRPEAFALCEKYMARQTVKPIQWIVLDDGRLPAVCTMGQEYYYDESWRGEWSLAKKIIAAIPKITGDIVIWAEDDDFYAPDWIEFCVQNLETCDLFGEGRALYYNVRGRWWQRHNNVAETTNHASFCSTACRRIALPSLLRCSEQCAQFHTPWIDTLWWRDPELRRRVIDPMTSNYNFRHRTVGIKSMPGKVGYSDQHKRKVFITHDDPELEFLRSLIGDDAEAYAPFYDPTWGTDDFIQPPTLRTTPVNHSITGQMHGNNWFSWLDRLRGKDGIRGLDIGTYDPDIAQWMISNVFMSPTSEFYCAGPDDPSAAARLKTRLNQSPRVQCIACPPEGTISGTQAFDMVYVGREHGAAKSYRDAGIAFEVLKRGGILIFADYTWAGEANYSQRPKGGIDQFVAEHVNQLQELRPVEPVRSQRAFLKL